MTRFPILNSLVVVFQQFLSCIFVFAVANMLQTERKIIVLHEIFTSCNQLVVHLLLQRSVMDLVFALHTYMLLFFALFFVVAT